MRYANLRFAPDRPVTWVPHAPKFPPELRLRWTAAMLAAERMARTEKPGACAENATAIANGRFRASNACESAAGDGRDIRGHGLGVRVREELGGHAPGARAAALDRLELARLVEAAELVEVRASDAVRLDRLERVAALAVGDEELLALLLLGRRLLAAEAAGAALRLAPGGDHGGGHGHAEAQVEQQHRDREDAAAAGEIRLPRRARTAREGDEDHEQPDDDEGHENEQDFHAARHNTGRGRGVGAALPRAPGSADGVGRARPMPTSRRQCGQRRGSSGHSADTFFSIRR